MSERRNHPRRYLKSYLQVLDGDTSDIIGHIVNISIDGAMMISEKPISKGTSLQLRLVLPEQFEGNETIDIHSQSVWCLPDRFNPELFASGFTIETINQPDETFIERFIEKFCLGPTNDTSLPLL